MFPGKCAHYDALVKSQRAPHPVTRRGGKCSCDSPGCRFTHNQWMCLTCGHVGCGRNDGKHALSHSVSTGHPIVTSPQLGGGSFCYKCDKDCNIPAKALDALLVPFDPPPSPAVRGPGAYVAIFLCHVAGLAAIPMDAVDTVIESLPLVLFKRGGGPSNAHKFYKGGSFKNEVFFLRTPPCTLGPLVVEWEYPAGEIRPSVKWGPHEMTSEEKVLEALAAELGVTLSAVRTLLQPWILWTVDSCKSDVMNEYETGLTYFIRKHREIKPRFQMREHHMRAYILLPFPSHEHFHKQGRRAFFVALGVHGCSVGKAPEQPRNGSSGHPISRPLL